MATTETWTVGRLLDWTAQHLTKGGAETPRLDAEVLLADALGCPRIGLYTRYDEPATEDVRAKYKALVRRRVEGCPVAYLVGAKEFYSLRLAVSPATLIPRPATETLVMAALALAKPLAAPTVLDIGTGSGAIAIAVAKKHAQAQVTATDISPDALAVARRNAETHGVAARVRFLEGDLFAPVPAGERFDLLLSNPPYIATDVIPTLPVGVRQYEPHLALDGGPGGYQVIDRLLSQARRFLGDGGHLLVEIGADQEAPVRQLVAKHGGFADVAVIQDYDRHPRVLRARAA